MIRCFFSAFNQNIIYFRSPNWGDENSLLCIHNYLDLITKKTKNQHAPYSLKFK